MMPKYRTCLPYVMLLAAPCLAQPVSFNSPLIYPIGFSPLINIVVADVNGDGKPDLVASISTNYYQIMLGNGDGSFNPIPAVYIPNGVVCVAVSDFNGDGKPDLAISSDGSSGYRTVGILIGNGNGTFQPPQYSAVGMGPIYLVAGDFNHDGKSDLAVANYNSNSVSILLGKGNGTFQPARSYAAQTQPRSLAIADFNRDGNPDLAVGNYG